MTIPPRRAWASIVLIRRGQVKLAPPPRRSKGKPSISEYVARGFKPSDEISKPSRRELEDALDRAGKMATALGYRLLYGWCR